MRRKNGLLWVAIGLLFGGALLASVVQRGGGGVELSDLRFAGTGGLTMSGLLYVPSNATAQTPAPAVLAIHGYINSRETQSPYAIELARRGYVVLALDQTGHGYSSPPAFANGFGGPDGLAYLRSLPMVDRDQIVLEGHSMGGWASLIAAGTFPKDYRAIAVSGSSPGTFGAPEGTASFPRNLGLVFGRYDEFSNLMWGVPVARDIVATAKLKKLFGTDQTVEVGQLYGSIAEGTARRLYMPSQTHPANHITRSGVGSVLDWIQQVTPAPHPLPPDDQTWVWKEFGTLLSLIGAVLLLFAVGGRLLDSPWFADLQKAPAPALGASGGVFWLAVVLTVIMPALTYFPVQEWVGKQVKASALWPQNITTGLMSWALCTGLLSMALFALWHVITGRRQGAGLAHYGLGPAQDGRTGRMIGRSLSLGFVVVGCAYLALVVTDAVFKTDFRFWVVAAKPLAPLHFRIALSYLVPFTAYFVMLGLGLHGQLRAPGGAMTLGRVMLRDAALTGGSFVLLLLVQYVPLFGGGTLAFPEESLLTIVAFQLVIVLPVVGAISSYFFYRTGRLYVGAMINGLLITWLLVGGQATHHPF
jgi:hypothetical protein